MPATEKRMGMAWVTMEERSVNSVLKPVGLGMSTLGVPESPGSFSAN